jgi:putative ABC transport system permease protein
MKQPPSKLPKFGDWILRVLARYDVNPHLRGDFDEEFSSIYETEGFVRAWFWYWTHLLLSLPVFIRDILYWKFIMLKNYLKFAIRNIIKHKGYSFINILGLSVSMACFMLIMLFVQHDLSIDRYHENSERIYRVQGENGRQLSMAPAVGKWIAENVIEAEKVVRFKFRHDYLVKYRPHNDPTHDRTIVVRDFGWSDPTVFDVFSFPPITGDPGTALDDPFALVLTESVAQRLFGSENPVGKTLEVNNRFEYHVTAVIEDLKRTHLRFDVLAPFENLGKIIGQSELDSFDSWNLETFVLLPENHDTAVVAGKITDLFHDRLKELWNVDFVFDLFPLKDIFFSAGSSFQNHGSRPLVFVFMAVAAFILLIACVNFLNLSTARASLRTKEVGIKKVVGSTRRKLVFQFLGESVLFSLISFAAAVGLVSLFLPEFNSLMQRSLSMNCFANPLILLVFIAVAVLVGILAGIYPAFYLSAFRPVSVLKGESTKGIRSGISRKVLISFQFTVSILLIIATLVVLKQIQYIRNKDLGFNKDHIVYMEIYRNRDIRDNKQAFKNRLMQHPLIRNVTYSQGRPGLVYNWEGFEYEGERKGYAIFTVDPDYVDVYGLEILAGRNFSREMLTDPYRTCLLNETAVRQLGLEKPVGTILRHDDLGGSSFPVKDVEVIGVVRDFHYQTLHYKIQPMMFGWNDPWLWMISVKIAAERVPETLAYIEKTWKEFCPGFPFDFHFIDELVDSQYKNEERLAKTIAFFAALGIFIACLGLFGLASFLAEQRTKEIGVRKVLGASVGGILMLQSKEFSKWVVAGNMVAWPLAYYAMNKWLADFAYRTNIGIWPFLTAAVLVLSIALLAVGYQSIKAATANPVDSLRYE